MNSGNAPKILRVGIIQGGKIVEERLIKKRESVTVGPDGSNHFIVATGNLPPVFPLFELKNGQYQLVFSDSMSGRVRSGESEIDFSALREQGQAKKRGDVYVYPLSDSSKGKITFGTTTLLFQFVPAPVETARAELPPNLRGSFWKNMDRLFLTVLTASLLIHFSGATFIILQERPPETEIELDKLDDRFAKVIMPTKVEEPPVEKAEEVAKAESQEKKEEPKKEDSDKKDVAPAPSPAKEALDRKQAIQKAVASKGMLKILGSASGSGTSAFEDVLGSGTGSKDVAEAIAGAGGVGVATSETLATGPKGSGTGTVAGIGSLGTSGGGNVNLGNKGDVKVSGRVQDAAPDVDSADVDRAALAKYVKSRMSAIQSCYERELKRNPSLRGKVVIRFAITPAGRSAEIEIEENTLASDSVASCIRTVIRTWVFPFKPESEVQVAYPFVFTPAS